MEKVNNDDTEKKQHKVSEVSFRLDARTTWCSEATLLQQTSTEIERYSSSKVIKEPVVVVKRLNPFHSQRILKTSYANSYWHQRFSMWCM